jgi:murein DD-endopeptidase MepM/ murein hydrolase activator NlpD
MDMAATGIPSARGLAQPPERPDPAPCRRGLRFPIWAAAVLMISAFGLIVAGAVASGANAAATSTTVPGDGAVIVPILFPLENRVTWTDTFGAPRSGGRTHAGNDLMVPKMTPLLAVVDGTVDWLNLTGKLSSYNSLPYYNILLHGDDGNDYFYIHLNNDTPGTDDGKGGVEYAYAPGLTNGSRVNMGDVIGYAGDSGNAEDAGSQLHFEIHLGGYVAASAGETRTPSAIDPYNSLKAAPTLAEWEAAGRPPIATMVTQPGSDASTSTSVTTTTSSPASSTPTTTVRPSTTAAATTTTVTTIPSGSAVPGFTDVHTDDWFYADFAQAEAAGVVVGSADQRFRPYSKVSRALFAVYLVRAMAPAELDDLTSSGGTEEQGTFSDVPPGYWAYNEIEIAARLHLVQGTGDGSTYSPDELVTRAQMATMMCRALDINLSGSVAGSVASQLIFLDVPGSYWAQRSIVSVDQLGLMCGDREGLFRPLDNATRAQAITVMARLMRLLEGGSGS